MIFFLFQSLFFGFALSEFQRFQCKPFDPKKRRTFVLFAQCHHEVLPMRRSSYSIGNGSHGYIFMDPVRHGPPILSDTALNHSLQTIYFNYECWVDGEETLQNTLQLSNDELVWIKAHQPNHAPFYYDMNTRGWYEDSGGKAHQNECANDWFGQCQADWNKKVSLENPRLSIRTLEQRHVYDDCVVLDFATRPWYAPCQQNVLMHTLDGSFSNIVSRDISHDRGTPFCSVDDNQYVMSDFACAVRGCEQPEFLSGANDCCYKGFWHEKYSSAMNWDDHVFRTSKIEVHCFPKVNHTSNACDSATTDFIQDYGASLNSQGRFRFPASDWLMPWTPGTAECPELKRNRCANRAANLGPVVLMKSVAVKVGRITKQGLTLSAHSPAVAHLNELQKFSHGKYVPASTWSQKYEGGAFASLGWSYIIEYGIEIRRDAQETSDKAFNRADCFMLLNRELTRIFDAPVEHEVLSFYSDDRRYMTRTPATIERIQTPLLDSIHLSQIPTFHDNTFQSISVIPNISDRRNSTIRMKVRIWIGARLQVTENITKILEVYGALSLACLFNVEWEVEVQPNLCYDNSKPNWHCYNLLVLTTRSSASNAEKRRQPPTFEHDVIATETNHFLSQRIQAFATLDALIEAQPGKYKNSLMMIWQIHPIVNAAKSDDAESNWQILNISTKMLYLPSAQKNNSDSNRLWIPIFMDMIENRLLRKYQWTDEASRTTVANGLTMISHYRQRIPVIGKNASRQQVEVFQRKLWAWIPLHWIFAHYATTSPNTYNGWSDWQYTSDFRNAIEVTVYATLPIRAPCPGCSGTEVEYACRVDDVSTRRRRRSALRRNCDSTDVAPWQHVFHTLSQISGIEEELTTMRSIRIALLNLEVDFQSNSVLFKFGSPFGWTSKTSDSTIHRSLFCLKSKQNKDCPRWHDNPINFNEILRGNQEGAIYFGTLEQTSVQRFVSDTFPGCGWHAFDFVSSFDRAGSRDAVTLKAQYASFCDVISVRKAYLLAIDLQKEIDVDLGSKLASIRGRHAISRIRKYGGDSRYCYAFDQRMCSVSQMQRELSAPVAPRRALTATSNAGNREIYTSGCRDDMSDPQGDCTQIQYDIGSEIYKGCQTQLAFDTTRAEIPWTRGRKAQYLIEQRGLSHCIAFAPPRAELAGCRNGDLIRNGATCNTVCRSPVPEVTGQAICADGIFDISGCESSEAKCALGGFRSRGNCPNRSYLWATEICTPHACSSTQQVYGHIRCEYHSSRHPQYQLTLHGSLSCRSNTCNIYDAPKVANSLGWHETQIGLGEYASAFLNVSQVVIPICQENYKSIPSGPCRNDGTFTQGRCVCILETSNSSFSDATKNQCDHFTSFGAAEPRDCNATRQNETHACQTGDTCIVPNDANSNQGLTNNVSSADGTNKPNSTLDQTDSHSFEKDHAWDRIIAAIVSRIISVFLSVYNAIIQFIRV